MRIAFYAPLKPPDHPVASGDRQVARAIIATLEQAGHEVFLASRLRVRLKSGERDEEERLRVAAGAERARLGAAFTRQGAERPRIWLTYHPYYKSPDWLGPELSRAFAMVYVTAEASYAGKRETGPWSDAQRDVRAALRQAALNFYMAQRDREGLEKALGSSESLVHLPPFVDLARFVPPRRVAKPVVRLLTVAMMRKDVKLQSYRFLSEALARVTDLDWRLDIVGDGVARSQVQEAFAGLPGERIVWRGALEEPDLLDCYRNADVFAWPGIGEAYGMVYLEAQAMGLPVVALGTAGVPEVVRDGVSGILAADGDVGAYAKALRSLIANRARRVALGQGGLEYVHARHGVGAAAQRLNGAIQALYLESAGGS